MPSPKIKKNNELKQVKANKTKDNKNCLNENKRNKLHGNQSN